jgi:PiT family inorganic phosphate transporter
VLLATWLGMPTSTTHALTGALLGAALSSNSGGVNWSVLVDKFAQPLLLSPLLAIVLTLMLYFALHRLRERLDIGATSCLCVGDKSASPSLAGAATAALRTHSPALEVALGTPRLRGAPWRPFVGVDADSAVNALHFECRQRVLRSRHQRHPKIAALLLTATAVSGQVSRPGSWCLSPW